ncbi:hypothetical protein BDL97_17G101700 [Sphagnum fallax]|nr:hypothetical protein BDL97_17G101700 [Sphagnum fallax]KAH8936765.1 hypothetical protein BDL97_17G101700 [Sphagnum fallax]KAH8936766.1 hypothetical protein BDL97_17G101700 [Sphagnum fallax]
MAGVLNGAAAGNRRAQGEQMSQWTNKSNIGRRRMQCAYCDMYGHIGIASAEAFQGLILALLQPQRCEVYWRIWQLDIHVDTADLPSAHPVVPLPSLPIT